MHRTWHPALVVAYRMVLSWRTLWRQFLLMRLVEPAIFFYGIGLGLGTLIPTVQGYDYKSFLLPGSMALSLMFGSIMDGSYSAFTRAFLQRTWPSFLATPTRLIDIMIGEMAWCALRNVMATTLLLIAGLLLGAKVSVVGYILAIPVIILISFALMAIGYVAAGLAKSMNDFDFLWAFVMTPMMVFSGVMVDPAVFPAGLRFLSDCLPLTHGIEALRGLLLTGIGGWQIIGHMVVLAVISGAAMALAHRLLKRRLMD